MKNNTIPPKLDFEILINEDFSKICMDKKLTPQENKKILSVIMLTILNELQEALRTDEIAYNAFGKHKGRVLEETVKEALKKLLGSTATIYESVYENPDSSNEHDLLITYKNKILIVECKATSIRKNFRDINRASKRILSDFSASIQEAHDQARNLKEKIQRNKIIDLYDQRGRVIVTIDHSKYESIECICVTRENEGCLATNLSILLKLNEADEYPLCINFDDLNHLVTCKDNVVHKRGTGITADLFIEYLKERKSLHKACGNDDELDILGYFLDEGSFSGLLKNDPDFFIIPATYSAKFDDAYRELQSHTSTVE